MGTGGGGGACTREEGLTCRGEEARAELWQCEFSRWGNGGHRARRAGQGIQVGE